MKRAFTLIEMLIVIVVLTTLMTIVFKLSNIGGDSWRRSETISRMQKLENCLSGYYAAFGSYPPVKLHGTRNINLAVTESGIQTDREQDVPWGNSYQAWKQVRAACLAQPVECNFPFDEGFSDTIKSMSDLLKEIVSEKTDGYEGAYQTKGEDDPSKIAAFSAGFDDGGGASLDSNSTDWRNVQIFRFGLMSYLLPRYLVMLDGREKFYTYAQWEDSNELPSDPLSGDIYSSWKEVRTLVQNSQSGDKYSLARVANIPSQSVCARWMPNLRGICDTYHKYVLFGVEVSPIGGAYMDVNSFIGMYGDGMHTPNGSSGNTDQYILDKVGLKDGWGNTFYYYSPAPYQRYTLWSSGPNGVTFPPWISRSTLDSQANKIVGEWIKDDIIGMSN